MRRRRTTQDAGQHPSKLDFFTPESEPCAVLELVQVQVRRLAVEKEQQANTVDCRGSPRSPIQKSTCRNTSARITIVGSCYDIESLLSTEQRNVVGVYMI